jgi:DnaJ-class molecular chaperone
MTIGRTALILLLNIKKNINKHMNVPECLSMLGLAEVPSDPAVVERAFRKRSLILHPDKSGTHQSFIRLKEARDALVTMIANKDSECMDTSMWAVNLAAFVMKHKGDNAPINVTVRCTLLQIYNADTIQTSVSVNRHCVSESTGQSEFVTESKLLSIKLLPEGINNKLKRKVVFKGAGNDHPLSLLFPKFDVRGDITVHLDVQEHAVIGGLYCFMDTVIHPRDLCVEVPITLYDYYHGGHKLVRFFGCDADIDVTLAPLKQKQVFTIPNIGLPYKIGDNAGRGNVVIITELELPAKFEEAIKCLSQLKATQDVGSGRGVSDCGSGDE